VATMAAVPAVVTDDAQAAAFVYINRAACPTLQGLALPTPIAFNWVFDNLLQMDDRHPAHLHFTQTGQNQLHTFLTLDASYFSGVLTYTDPRSADTTLNRNLSLQHRMDCRQLLDFYNYNMTYNGYVMPDLEACDPNIYDYFKFVWQVGRDYPRPSPPLPPAPGAPASIPTTRSGTTQTPLTEFQKGIRRNLSDYANLESDKDYVTWNEKLHAQALVHSTHQVLAINPPYLPTGPDDAALFQFKKVYMYSVFSSIVKTLAGIEIIRRYAPTQDGQAVYRDIRARYVDSPIAKLSLSTIHDEITTSKLTPSFNGTYESYIDHFCQLIRDHNSTCPVTESIPEDSKVTYLHRAVGSIQELTIVRTQIQLAALGRPYTFPEIVAMYKTASANIDFDRKAKPSARVVNNAHHSYEYDDVDDDHLAYQIFMAGRKGRPPPRDPNRPKRPGLPPEVWTTLSPDERTAWDKLSDAVKSAVIGCKPPQPPNPIRSVHNTVTTDDDDQYHDAIGETDHHDVTVHRASSTATKPSATKTSHGGTLGNLLGSNKSPSASS
jgi:hypothetical protein